MLKDFLQNKNPKNRMFKEIYFLIHHYGPISRSELLKITNMKKTTLARVIDELQFYEYISKRGFEKAAVGRPPVLYQANKDSGYLIGLHITRTDFRVLLTDIRFNILELEVITMTSLHTPSIVLPQIEEIIKKIFVKHELTNEELLGIGIGAIGPLDTKSGKIFEPDPFPAPGWMNISIVDYFSKRFSVKCMLEYGVNMAAFGEHTHELKMYDNLLYCMSGREFGCGVVTDGKLFNNSHVGDVGRYGHMTIHTGGKKCSCGKNGCLIAYTSPQSILSDIMEQSNSGDSWNYDLDKPKTSELVEFLKQGKEGVSELVYQSAYCLGIGISNLITIFNSEAVVLNGPLINEYPYYYEQTVKTIQEYTNLTPNHDVYFSKASSKDDSGAIGAAIYLFYSYFEM